MKAYSLYLEAYKAYRMVEAKDNLLRIESQILNDPKICLKAQKMTSPEVFSSLGTTRTGSQYSTRLSLAMILLKMINLTDLAAGQVWRVDFCHILETFKCRAS